MTLLVEGGGYLKSESPPYSHFVKRGMRATLIEKTGEADRFERM